MEGENDADGRREEPQVMVGLFPDSQGQLTHHNRTEDKCGHVLWWGAGALAIFNPINVYVLRNQAI